MKKKPNVLRVLLAVPIVLLLLAGAALLWIASYRCHDAALIAQLREQSQALARARDQRCQDETRNGFSQVDALLGEQDKEDDAQLDSLALLPWSRSDQPADVPLVAQLNTPAFQERLRRYQSTLPFLQGGLSKPDFLWESHWAVSPDRRNPQLRKLRRLTHAAVAYADYLRLQHRDAEALAHLTLFLRLGSHVSAQGNLHTALFGMALQSIVQDPILELINSGALRGAELKAALAHMQSLDKLEDLYPVRMEEDFAIQMDRVDHESHAHEPADEDSRFWLAKHSGWLERDRRVLQNYHLLLRSRYLRLALVEDSGVTGPDFTENYAKANYSELLSLFMPNCARSIAFVASSASRMSAIKILLALQLYRAEHQVYPATLADLVPAYLPELPRDWCSQDGTFVYLRDGQDCQLSSQRSPGAVLALHNKIVPYRPFRMKTRLI